MKLVSAKHFLSLHKTVEKAYQKKALNILNYCSHNPILPHSFLSYLKKEKKSSFHPLKFYFLELLDDYLTVSELEAENNLNELFDYWSESEFAPDFFHALKSTKNDLQKSCSLVGKLFAKHVEAFYQIHILGNNKKFNSSYRPIIEIGDYVKNRKIQTFEFGEIKSIELNNGFYPYISFICNDDKKKNLFLKRISKALDIIKTYSPNSYLCFSYFTHTITPIKDKKIVSYSTQKLPGYSVINFYHRDFVDLIDDLIHENGHHHLNYYLNYTSLIIEDSEKIFYSPWRKQLRPIRGIYHAVFTFYWAMALFRDLAVGIENDKINYFKFSKKQQCKIHLRFLEEYQMLRFSFHDLHNAYKLGKITSKGYKLISLIEAELDHSKNQVLKSTMFLKNNSDKDFQRYQILIKELKNARRHYDLKIP